MGPSFYLASFYFWSLCTCHLLIHIVLYLFLYLCLYQSWLLFCSQSLWKWQRQGSDIVNPRNWQQGQAWWKTFTERWKCVSEFFEEVLRPKVRGAPLKNSCSLLGHGQNSFWPQPTLPTLESILTLWKLRKVCHETSGPVRVNTTPTQTGNAFRNRHKGASLSGMSKTLITKR